LCEYLHMSDNSLFPWLNSFFLAGLVVSSNFQLFYLLDTFLSQEKSFTDNILCLKMTEDAIEVADPEFTDTPPGSGPRHLAIDEDRELAYVLHELKSLIEIYRIEPESGKLSLFTTVDLLAESPIPHEVWDFPLQVWFRFC